MTADVIKASQASFIIGPPTAPEELKSLYQKLGAEPGQQNSLLAKKLFETRKDSVTVFSNVTQNGKSLLHRMLEGILRKDVAKVESAITQSMVRGEPAPCLTISLQKSAYSDGTPLAANLTRTAVKDLEMGIRMAFKAEWVQSVVV